MFRVFTTKEFDNDFNKLDGSEKSMVRKILEQLKEQGADVGKPLQVPYFREKKFNNKRLYFLVYKDLMVIFTIAIEDKKAQQETINKILTRIDYYKKLIIEKLKDID